MISYCGERNIIAQVCIHSVCYRLFPLAIEIQSTAVYIYFISRVTQLPPRCKSIGLCCNETTILLLLIRPRRSVYRARLTAISVVLYIILLVYTAERILKIRFKFHFQTNGCFQYVYGKTCSFFIIIITYYVVQIKSPSRFRTNTHPL